ncbi:MAG: hypothetical protein WBN07_00635 [Woeseiaceae bacterium]
MTKSYDKPAALAVLPAVTGGRLQNSSLRAWLAQAELAAVSPHRDMLRQITGELDLPYPEEGLAALRMWGQTGERPTVWIAAADPVYLEPRLDNLCLHDLSGGQIAPADFRELIEHLQETLGGDDRVGFIRLGQYGYLRAQTPMPTAAVPGRLVDQQAPGDFLPTGAEASVFRNLLSEIEMTLHEHAANQRRAAEGRPPMNSLWLWGGGNAPPRTTRSQPRLFSNEPLLLGYWDSANATANLWPGSMVECLNASGDSGFVAVAPADEDDPAFLEACLRQLREALLKKRLRQVTILFRDGLRADIVRSQRLRFWRRDSRLLD